MKNKSGLQLDMVDAISIFDDEDTAYAYLMAYDTGAAKPKVLSFVNAHAYNLSLKKQKFYDALMSSDIIFRDGFGMEILFRILGRSPGVNLNGTDFIPFLLRANVGRQVALLGTEEPFVGSAKRRLEELGHNVVLAKNGFSPVEDYLIWINEVRPEIIILGMGMPKQEQLSALIKKRIDYSCLVINSGAILDCFGGKVKRAPYLMRYLKIEWLYRLITEPKRLYNRYTVGIIEFFWAILKFRFSKEAKKA